MSKRKKMNKKGSVAWYLPNKKRPVAHSTTATKDLIDVLAEDDLTIQEIYDRINYDEDAKKILKIYIDNGYGNARLFGG